MASRSLKALRSIFLDGEFSRIWQVINKTSLIQVSAWIRRFGQLGVYGARKNALREILWEPKVQQTLQELRVHGYTHVNHLLSAEDLKLVDAYIAEKRSHQQKAQDSQIVKTKDFWVRLSDEDLTQGLTTENPIVKISLSEKILQLAGGYLGQVPFLEYVLLTLSLPSEKPLQASQLWHRDHDNHRMLKFFIYLTDVLEDGDGPFTFFDALISKQVPNSFFPKHLTDSFIYSHVEEKNITQMKGKKWTAFVCDTSRCYHMGSRLQPGHERLMLTSLFLALPSAYPNYGKNKIQAASNLSELQRKAIQV